ncbi:MAG: DUF2807 domain-containing protein [Spirochaetaceae bacterium]|nr:DUF2807 domain-containing protein [Spirochaetaceae bacterium]
MKRLLFSIVLLYIIFIISACSLINIEGSGEIKTDEFPYRDFSSVDAVSTCDVTIKEGKEYSVTIKCDNNISPYLNTFVRGNTLYIGLKDSYIFNNFTFQATIVMPAQKS